MPDTVKYARCPQCGSTMFPILDHAPCGHETAQDVLALNRPGIVYSWTIVHTGDQPRTLVMADFDYAGVRISGPLVDTDQIAIGDSVLVVPGVSTPHALRAVT